MSASQRPSSARPGVRRALVAGLLTMVAAPACGVGVDDAPRDLAVSSSTTTTLPEESVGDAPAVLYMVQGEHLVPITRALPSRSDEAVVESLLMPPTAADGQDLSSSIPAGTELLGLSVDGDQMAIDLSSNFEGVVGPDRQDAIAQIVLTVSEDGEASSFRFSVDGTPVKVTSPSRGDVDEVTACDFANLLADPNADGAELTEGQSTLLQLRREDLATECAELG